MNVADKIAKHTTTINTQLKQKGRAQGRLDAEVDNLKRLGFDSEEDARAYVEEATAEWEQEEQELIKDVEEFEHEYAKFLS